MNSNKIKNVDQNSNNKERKKYTLFGFINKIFGFEKVFEAGIPLEKLYKIVFLSTLGLIYIANSHLTDKMIRKIDKLKREVEDLRADYITQKAEYMFDSKQSEVAKKVEPLGLIESKRPPYKIVITKEELKKMPF
jgi:hypothetical protein